MSTCCCVTEVVVSYPRIWEEELEEESAAAAAAADRGVNFKLGSHTCLVIGWCSVAAAALLLSISSILFFLARSSSSVVEIGPGVVVEARTDNDCAGSMDDLFWKALSSFLAAGFMKATPSDGDNDDDDVVGKDLLALLLLLSISWDINARVR